MSRSGGAKLGTRIAMLVSRAIVYTHQKLVGAKHTLAMAVFHSISDTISEEVHRTIGGTLTEMYDGLPEGSQSKALLKFMSQEYGQLQALLGYAASASGLTASVSTIMNNELAPVVYTSVFSNPHLIPDVQTIAQLATHGQISKEAGIVGIGENGIGAGWAQGMINMAATYPSITDSLEMLRRGLINTDAVLQWAVLNGIPADIAEKWLQLEGIPISPADAALAYLRGSIDGPTAQDYASQSGISAKEFAILVNNTGEPLGLEQLLEARRRNFITDEQLTQGILESRVRDEWIPTAKKLAYSPMTISDAVNAVVQNQLDKATAATYAEENGLMPGQFDVLLNTAGEPLSRTEMEDLYNRGEATEADVLQALSESRLKDKYGQLAFKLHERLLNPSTLSDAVLYGAMDQNAAVEQAMKLGYSAESATTIVLSASHEKLYSYTVRIVESIANLYEVNAIDQTTATGYITDLGFSADEASVILQSAEYNRIKRMQSAAVNAVRSKYVSHHTTQDDAQSALQEIGVPAGEITQLIGLWNIELSANVRRLSEAQVVKAVNLTLMSQDEGMAYLLSMGYSETDAGYLLAGA